MELDVMQGNITATLCLPASEVQIDRVLERCSIQAERIRLCHALITCELIYYRIDYALSSWRKIAVHFLAGVILQPFSKLCDEQLNPWIFQITIWSRPMTVNFSPAITMNRAPLWSR